MRRYIDCILKYKVKIAVVDLFKINQHIVNVIPRLLIVAHEIKSDPATKEDVWKICVYIQMNSLRIRIDGVEHVEEGDLFSEATFIS